MISLTNLSSTAFDHRIYHYSIYVYTRKDLKSENKDLEGYEAMKMIPTDGVLTLSESLLMVLGRGNKRSLRFFFMAVIMGGGPHMSSLLLEELGF